MPRGPRGEKRPADVIGAAIMVARIATGETPDSLSQRPSAPKRANGGKLGGKARAEKLSKKQRVEIATKAAKARWKR
jgi:hypothetical protein